MVAGRGWMDGDYADAAETASADGLRRERSAPRVSGVRAEQAVQQTRAGRGGVLRVPRRAAAQRGGGARRGAQGGERVPRRRRVSRQATARQTRFRNLQGTRGEDRVRARVGRDGDDVPNPRVRCLRPGPARGASAHVGRGVEPRSRG